MDLTTCCDRQTSSEGVHRLHGFDHVLAGPLPRLTRPQPSTLNPPPSTASTLPGAGDKEVIAAGKLEEMKQWITFAASWGEYMFSYGNNGGEDTTAFVNGFRLAHLRRYLHQVLQEEPKDEELVSAYVKKIGGHTHTILVFNSRFQSTRRDFNSCTVDDSYFPRY